MQVHSELSLWHMTSVNYYLSFWLHQSDSSHVKHDTRDIPLSDILLTGLCRVSRGSWQPVFAIQGHDTYLGQAAQVTHASSSAQKDNLVEHGNDGLISTSGPSSTSSPLILCFNSLILSPFVAFAFRPASFCYFGTPLLAGRPNVDWVERVAIIVVIVVVVCIIRLSPSHAS